MHLQVCLSFQLHRGVVVLAKSVKPSRIEENLKSTEIKLDAEDMRRLGELDRGFRYVNVRSLHMLLCDDSSVKCVYNVSI